MKSILFRASFDNVNSDSAKSFARDLHKALDLNENDRKACLRILGSIHLARTDSQKKQILDQLVIECQKDLIDLSSVLSIMNFILKALISKEIPQSDSDYWGEDLEEIGWIDGNSRSVFESLLKEIKSVPLNEIKKQIELRRTASGVLPSFTGCSITVEIRPVKKDIYRWGTPINEYKPEIIDVTPVVSISIGVDVENTDDFFFQADEEEIDHLINALQAAKIDLLAFQKYLGLN